MRISCGGRLTVVAVEPLACADGALCVAPWPTELVVRRSPYMNIKSGSEQFVRKAMKCGCVNDIY